MIIAQILNVYATSKLFLFLDNFKWMVLISKKTTKKVFKGSQTTWNIVFKPAVNVAAPFIGMAVSA